MFDGLRVIDCGSYVAAPAAATVLSDFGADVIKIEPPGAGDPYRALYLTPGHPVSDANYGWMLDSRNKRSLALDLAHPDGRAVLRRLVEGADVFITNLPLPARRRLEIDHETLLVSNHRLVYASFTGYGERGEEATKPGFDLTAWWARSGMMDICRSSAGAVPAKPTVAMGDHPAAIALFAGIAVALYRRERTGQGGLVSSSLLANGLWANAYLAQAALCGALTVDRTPREESPNALTTYYRCRDGLWLVLGILNEDRYWPVLAACLNRGDLLTDARFATRADRLQHSVELVAELDASFATRDRDAWRSVLHDNGIVFEIVATPDDIPGDEQLRANEILVPSADGESMTIDSPFAVDGSAKVPPRAAPDAVGEHTDEILREAGYDDSTIAALRASAAVS